MDEKDRTLCDGVYQYFSQWFGTKKQKQGKRPRQSKEQMKRLEELKRQKNEARRKLRQVKRSNTDEMAIRAVARDFHHLLRIHSKVFHLTVKTRAKLEALKARRSCAKSFWHFAAQLLVKISMTHLPLSTLMKLSHQKGVQ